PGKAQTIDAGSYMIVEKAPPIAARPFTFFAMIWPTLPERHGQTLISQWDVAGFRGFRVVVHEGRLGILTADGYGAGKALTTKSMLPRQWYSVAVAVDPASHTVTLDQVPIGNYAQTDDRDHVEARLDAAPGAVEAPLLIAGALDAEGGV